MSFFKSIGVFVLGATQSLAEACFDGNDKEKKCNDHNDHWRTQDGQLITDPNDVNIQKENAVYLRD